MSEDEKKKRRKMRKVSDQISIIVGNRYFQVPLKKVNRCIQFCCTCSYFISAHVIASYWAQILSKMVVKFFYFLSNFRSSCLSRTWMSRSRTPRPPPSHIRAPLEHRGSKPARPRGASRLSLTTHPPRRRPPTGTARVSHRSPTALITTPNQDLKVHGRRSHGGKQSP